MSCDDLTNIQDWILRATPLDFFESPTVISQFAFSKMGFDYANSSHGAGAIKKLLRLGYIEKGICERTKRAGYKRIK